MLLFRKAYNEEDITSGNKVWVELIRLKVWPQCALNKEYLPFYEIIHQGVVLCTLKNKFWSRIFQDSQFNKMYLYLSWKYKKIPNRDSDKDWQAKHYSQFGNVWRHSAFKVQIDCNPGIIFKDSQSVIYVSECAVTVQRYHTKRGIGGVSLANLSFGMTMTKILKGPFLWHTEWRFHVILYSPLHNSRLATTHKIKI